MSTRGLPANNLAEPANCRPLAGSRIDEPCALVQARQLAHAQSRTSEDVVELPFTAACATPRTTSGEGEISPRRWLRV